MLDVVPRYRFEDHAGRYKRVLEAEAPSGAVLMGDPTAKPSCGKACLAGRGGWVESARGWDGVMRHEIKRNVESTADQLTAMGDPKVS